MPITKDWCAREGGFKDCAECLGVQGWTHENNECEKILNSIRPEEDVLAEDLAGKIQALQAAAKELGMVVVPVEPTMTMCAAGETAGWVKTPDGDDRNMLEVFKAMVDASQGG